MRFQIPEDHADLVFRVLFSTIFVGLGMEHIVADDLLQALMPQWVGHARLVSIVSGAILLGGGLSIMIGYRTKVGAAVLLLFLLLVTASVHLPGVLNSPPEMPEQWQWLWTVFQRSNFVKNICLIGVCVHLLVHKPKRFSLDCWLQGRRSDGRSSE